MQTRAILCPRSVLCVRLEATPTRLSDKVVVQTLLAHHLHVSQPRSMFPTNPWTEPPTAIRPPRKQRSPDEFPNRGGNDAHCQARHMTKTQHSRPPCDLFAGGVRHSTRRYLPPKARRLAGAQQKQLMAGVLIRAVSGPQTSCLQPNCCEVIS